MGSPAMNLPGFKVLLMGPSGTGKTTSLRTLLSEGFEIFAIFTEPRFDVLGAEVLSKIHYRYLAPASLNWQTLTSTARLVNSMTVESLTKLSSTGGPEFQQLIELYSLCNNFIDQHGQSYGDVASWGTDRLLWVDSLTGINSMARKLKAGTRVTLTQPEWGICMTMIRETIDTLVTGLFCPFVLTAHIERELDEVTGMSRVMVSTMGRKLAPLIPVNFSDVIMTKRTSEGFFWSTMEPDADVKHGFCPPGNKLPPSFAPLVANWQQRGGALGVKPPEAWR